MNDLRRQLRKHPVEIAVIVAILMLLSGIAFRQAHDDARRAGPHVSVAKLEPGTLVQLSGGGLSRPVFAKVLAVGDGMVHVRTYAAGTNEKTPTTKRDFIAGHIPLSERAWDSMSSRRLGHEPVVYAELDGLREWTTSGGGAFDEVADIASLMTDELDQDEIDSAVSGATT